MIQSGLGNYVSAARGAPGGLHFGHYFGCFMPLDQIPSEEQLVFIVKDNAPALASMDSGLKQHIEAIAADALSCAESGRIVVCGFSNILRAAPLLYNLLLDKVTVNALFSYHFKKAELRKPESSVTMKYALFPIEEAFQMFSVGCRVLVCNDDNARFVMLARDLARKIRSPDGEAVLNSPVLLSNPRGGRLLGYDYRRMAKVNGNTLGLSATEGEVGAYVDALLSLGHYFDAYPDELVKFRENKHGYVVPDNYLAFLWLRTFAGSQVEGDDVFPYWKRRERLPELRERLVGALLAVTRAIAVRRASQLGSTVSGW